MVLGGNLPNLWLQHSWVRCESRRAAFPVPLEAGGEMGRERPQSSLWESSGSRETPQGGWGREEGPGKAGAVESREFQLGSHILSPGAGM